MDKHNNLLYKNKYLYYKNKYLELKEKYNSSNNMLLNINDKLTTNMDKQLMENGVGYNSAGVIFIYNGNFILFKSSQTDENFDFFCDVAGGGIDKEDKTIEESASRELFEESRMMFKINPLTLEEAKKTNGFIKIPGRTIPGRRLPGQFACYVLGLDYIDPTVYYKNKEVLSKLKLPKYYYETDEVVYIPIETMKQYFKEHQKPYQYTFIKDNKNKYRKITLLALYSMYKILDDKIFEYPVRVQLIKNDKFLTYMG